MGANSLRVVGFIYHICGFGGKEKSVFLCEADSELSRKKERRDCAVGTGIDRDNKNQMKCVFLLMCEGPSMVYPAAGASDSHVRGTARGSKRFPKLLHVMGDPAPCQPPDCSVHYFPQHSAPPPGKCHSAVAGRPIKATVDSSSPFQVVTFCRQMR